MKTIVLRLFVLVISCHTLKAQTIQSVIPNQANAGQTLNVTITGVGTHFGQQTPATYIDFGFTQCSGTVVNSMTVISPTSINANITVPALSRNGKYDMQVWNPIDGLLTLDNFYQINSTLPNLTMTPGNGLPSQTLTVTISGSGTLFTQNSGTSSVSFKQWRCSSPFSFSTSNTTVTNDSLMNAVVSIPSNAPLGFYDAQVTGGQGYFPNTFLIDTTTDLISIDLENQIFFYPNPFSKEVQINISTQNTGDYKLFAFDLTGREIFNRQGVLNSIKKPLSLRSKDFNDKPGIYLIAIQVGSKKYIGKLVLQK